MYKMVVTPDPVLLKKAQRVTGFDKKLKKIVAEMSETLDATRDPVGVGLAAPQVGISKQIFLMKPEENAETQVFVNPEIIDSSDDEEVPLRPNSAKVELMKKLAEKKKKRPGKKGRLLEGCLSIPNIWGNVSRKKSVKIKYQDIEGVPHTEEFKGFQAIIIQHETDHLNGILFTKHVLAQGEQLYKSFKNEDGEDEFEEIEV